MHLSLWKAKRRRFTYDDAKETLQSSDVELAKGLKDRRVLILEGLSLHSTRHRAT